MIWEGEGEDTMKFFSLLAVLKSMDFTINQNQKYKIQDEYKMFFFEDRKIWKF